MAEPKGDIEDLYRDFAANYPLKTDDNGWDALQGKMGGNTPQPGRHALPKKPPLSIGRYIYALLAVPVICIILAVVFTKKEAPVSPASSVTNTQPGQPMDGNVVATDSIAKINPITRHDSLHKPVVEAPAVLPVKTPQTVAIATAQPVENKRLAKTNAPVKPPVEDAMANAGLGEIKSDGEKAKPGKTDPEKRGQEKTEGEGLSERMADKQTGVDGAPVLTAGQGRHLSMLIQNPVKVSGVMADWDAQASVTGNGVPPVAIVPDSLSSLANAANAAVNNNLPGGAQQAITISTKARTYFYMGLIAGPDISAVNFQPVKGTGKTMGITLGYHAWKNASIESGVLFTSKKYYSSGEYYRRESIPQPGQPYLKSLTAVNSFIEVPLTLKFTVTQKKLHSFFVNAGLSSYFGLQEKDNFLFHAQGGIMHLFTINRNPPGSFFSILDVSLGYEKAFTNGNSIRIEPYFKLPLVGGLGNGALPIASSGFYINFSHRF